MRKLSFIISLALLAACTEQPEVTPYEYPRIFTGDEKKGWSIRSYQYTEEGSATQTGQLAECIEDDLYIFYANTERKMEIREGNTTCSEGDPDLIAEGTWSFSNTGATMTIPFPLLVDGVLPFIVREVDDDELVLEIFFNDNKSSYRFNFVEADIE
jgi:hypothetical protein